MPSGHWWLYPGFLDIKRLVFCFVLFLRHRIDIAMNHTGHAVEAVLTWDALCTWHCVREQPHTHTAYHLLCLPVGCYLLFICTFWMCAILEISIHLALLKKGHYICHQCDFSTGSERLRKSPYLVLWFCSKPWKRSFCASEKRKWS